MIAFGKSLLQLLKLFDYFILPFIILLLTHFILILKLLNCLLIDCRYTYECILGSIATFFDYFYFDLWSDLEIYDKVKNFGFRKMLLSSVWLS